MYRSFYAGMQLSHLPQLSLLLFMAVFLAALFRLFVMKRPADFAAVSALPFQDGDETQPKQEVRS